MNKMLLLFAALFLCLLSQAQELGYKVVELHQHPDSSLTNCQMPMKKLHKKKYARMHRCRWHKDVLYRLVPMEAI